MICISCDKEILPGDKKFWVGLDIPYKNLPFHRECFWRLPDLNEFLQENKVKIIKYELESIKIRKSVAQKQGSMI